MTKYTDEYVRDRMQELMKPMEDAIHGAKDVDEVLMIASAMMGYSKNLFVAMIGDAGARNLMESMLPEVPSKE